FRSRAHDPAGRRPSGGLGAGAGARVGLVGHARAAEAGRGAQPHGPAGGRDAGMNVLTWVELDHAGRAEALRRGTAAAGPEVTAGVGEILREVRTRGDEALLELTARLDGAAPETIEVPADARAAAVASLDPALRDAITEA